MYNCPKCQAPFEKGTRFCNSCGCNLEEDFIFDPVCPSCGKHYPDGTKFCDIDGGRLVSPDKLVPKCVRCGKEYPADTKFCPDDGGAVIAEAYRLPPSSATQPAVGAPGDKYPKADLLKRFGAYIIDRLICTGLAIPAIVFVFFGIIQLEEYGNNSGLVFVIIGFISVVIPAVYYFIKDGLVNGQSWGKRAVGLMVVQIIDDAPCTKLKSSLRGLITMLIGSVPLGSFVEPILVIATKNGRRLADLAAETKVIHIEDYRPPQYY